MLIRQRWSRAAAFVRAGHGAHASSSMERNIRLLYWDMAWFGLLFGVSANFLSVFVARLNASPWLLSAVTSGPALINILWQLPALRLVERAADLQRLIVRSALLNRLGFLLIALIPLLLPKAWQAYAIVATVLAQGLPTALMAVAFSTMFAGLVPRERVAAVVGMRNVLLGLTSTLVVLFSGAVLTALPFPRGYQAIFLFGFVASLGSIWSVARLQVEPRQARPAAGAEKTGAATSALTRDGNFVRFALGAGVLQFGMFMTAPLFPLLWVKTLQLGDGWVSIFATTLSLTSILGAFGVRWLAYRWRISTLLGGASVLFGLYPILSSVFSHPALIMLVAAFAGIWGGMINVTLFDGLAEVCPPAERARYMGVYTWLMNIAIFAGPLAGAGLANLAGVRIALLCAGIIRVAAGGIFFQLPFAAWDRAEPVLSHRMNSVSDTRKPVEMG